MPTPTTWIIGNWKQNLLRAPAKACAKSVAAALTKQLPPTDIKVGVAPTYMALDTVHQEIETSSLVLFAQDIAAQDQGAFTGEVGPAMLQEAGVHGALIGHSERRAHFGDTDELISRKLRTSLEARLTSVLCVGEQLDARNAGDAQTVVGEQLQQALGGLSPEFIHSRLVLAYEPVWAIGTGQTATPKQAEEMHQFIRRWLEQHFGETGRDRSILYGGSVKPGNASELFQSPEINGFLVGGASLDPESFLAIVRAVIEQP